MKKFRECLLLIILIQMSCVSIPKIHHDYYRPNMKTIKNDIYIEEAFETVWNRVVKNIAKSFFKINNIDKDSRIISISYTIPDYRTYIDCGRSVINITDHRNRKETFAFIDASDTNYVTVCTYEHELKHDFVVLPLKNFITRNVYLEGIANYYLAPKKDGTNIYINARLIIKVIEKIETVYFDGFGIFSHARNNTTSNMCIADTNNYCYIDYMKCCSTGKLEEFLLSFVNEQ